MVVDGGGGGGGGSGGGGGGGRWWRTRRAQAQQTIFPIRQDYRFPPIFKNRTCLGVIDRMRERSAAQARILSRTSPNAKNMRDWVDSS